MRTKIDERCRTMVLSMEWSLNLGDSQGPRCPVCQKLRGIVSEHADKCGLGQLSDDLRTIDLARALEEGRP